MLHCVHFLSSGLAAATISLDNLSLFVQLLGHQQRVLHRLIHDEATTSTDLSSGKTATAYFLFKFILHRTINTGLAVKMATVRFRLTGWSYAQHATADKKQSSSSVAKPYICERYQCG